MIRTLKDQLYFDAMVEEIKRTRVVRPPTTEQAPSTIANLSRPVEQDYEHWCRLFGPLPPGAIVNPDAKTLDERVGARALDPIEVSHFEATRRRPKNSLGQAANRGAGPALIAKAIDAMIYTPPAQVTKAEVEQRAVNLTQYKSEPVKEVWVEMPWYKALYHWITGNKIRSEGPKK